MDDKPGINGESFKITFNGDMKRGYDDIVTSEKSYHVLEVISKPVKHRYQWYWKILYYLTFGIFFWEYYTYDVKIKQDECCKNKTTNGRVF